MHTPNTYMHTPTTYMHTPTTYIHTPTYIHAYTEYMHAYTPNTYMHTATYIHRMPIHISTHLNSSAQPEIEPKSQFDFVPRDPEVFEFSDLVGFGDVAFLVESVMSHYHLILHLKVSCLMII